MRALLQRLAQRSDKERPWNLKHDKAMQRALAVFVLALVAQGTFWEHTRHIVPEMGIVPAVPGEQSVQALAMGDEEAYFRLLGLKIQNSGDTFGRFTALYKYDFNKLYHWFKLLDGLNDTSNYPPSMASYYFSQTQNRSDVRYMVQYLDEHTKGRAREKWWWVSQAAYLANNRLKDSKRALELAERLRGVKGIPLWAQQLAAFIHEQRGEFGEALVIIQEILRDTSQYSQGELNFMKYFIAERIGKLEEMEVELKAIQERKAKEIKAGIKPAPHEGPPLLD